MDNPRTMRLPSIPACAALLLASACGSSTTSTDTPRDMQSAPAPDQSMASPQPDLAMAPEPDLAMAPADMAGVAMTVTSTTFTEGGAMPKKTAHTFCMGGNVSPALAVGGVPGTAKSLAIKMEDLDLPVFKHWLAWDIPVGTRLDEGASAKEAFSQATNDFGEHGYGGPCPPVRHRYRFHVYALRDARLAVGPEPTIAAFDAAVAGSQIAEAQITGAYTP